MSIEYTKESRPALTAFNTTLVRINKVQKVLKHVTGAYSTSVYMNHSALILVIEDA